MILFIIATLLCRFSNWQAWQLCRRFFSGRKEESPVSLIILDFYRVAIPTVVGYLGGVSKYQFAAQSLL